ncbi:MAG TPA: hypothetical protein VFL83_22690 [Anaeromyxobacter sp.]|nr:hypothetical protein [Anaeromyxobacter sp.]
MVRTTIAVAVLVLAAALAPAPARAGDCKPVHGSYTSQAFFPPECPTSFCTAGEVIGGLQGAYTFTQTQVLPAAVLAPGDGALENALFYVGASDVTLRSGDHVYASDSGVIDVPPGTGKQAALLVISGGTGGHAGATGFLQLRGTLGPGGRVTGDFTGQICTP